MSEDAKKTDDVVKEAKRSFLGPDEESKYYLSTPTAEDIRGADWQYSKTYTRSLVEGITTTAEMQDILMRRGIIGPEFEQRANELAVDLHEKIILLEAAADAEDKRIFAIEVAQSREELFQWNQRLNGPLSNTCEQMSDDARLEYLTHRLIEDVKGAKVWTSYDEYLREKSQSLATRARFEVMLFLQGVDSAFLENTPEAVAMREIEEELIEKTKEAIKVAKEITAEDTVKDTKEETVKDTKKVSKAKAKTKPKAKAKAKEIKKPIKTSKNKKS